MTNHFKLNIKQLRQFKELTQSAFGGLFGLTRGQIDSYETKGTYPSIESANKICKHFNLTLDQLFNTTLSIQDLQKVDANATERLPIENREEEIVNLRQTNKALTNSIENLNEYIAELKSKLKTQMKADLTTARKK